MNRITLILAILVSPVCLTAQITFAEKPPVEKPRWEYKKDIMILPYDSSHVYIKCYPILEAYKKYVGQQVFSVATAYVRFYQNNNGKFREYEESTNHKYYEIIDVISCLDAGLKKQGEWSDIDAKRNYNYTDSKNKSAHFQVESDNIALFVLKDVQSMDTIYYPEWDGSSVDENSVNKNFVLVGGFIKLKEKMVGQNVVTYSDGRLFYNWKIIDVAIAEDNAIDNKSLYGGDEHNIPRPSTWYDSQETSERVAFVLQNRENNNIVRNLSVLDLEKEIKLFGGYISRYKKGFVLEKEWKKVQAYMKSKNEQNNQKIVQEEQKVAQEKAKRKQTLTNKYGAAMAGKIIAGEFEIGMSKAACKEIVGNARAVDRTETTEIWKIGDWISGETYLYFSGDKLVRIVKD